MRKRYWWNVSRLPATVPWLHFKFTLKFARSQLFSFTNTYWKIDNICILQIYVTVSFVWFVTHSESTFVSWNPWFICLGTKATTLATTVENTSAVLLQPSQMLWICLTAVYDAVIFLLLTSYHPWLSTLICSTPWSAQVVCIMLLALLSSAQVKNKQSRVEPRKDARGNNVSRSIVSLQQVFP